MSLKMSKMFTFEIVGEDAHGRSSNCHFLVVYLFNYVSTKFEKKIIMRTMLNFSRTKLTFAISTSNFCRNHTP